MVVRLSFSIAMAMRKSIVWLATLQLCAIIISVSGRPQSSCPVECVCFYQDSKLISDCSESEFTTIPTEGLSKDTAEFVLDGNQIKHIDTSLIDSPVRRYTNLRSLKLSKNLLTRIHSETFEGLRLIELDVSSNFITHIDPEAFM